MSVPASIIFSNHKIPPGAPVPCALEACFHVTVSFCSAQICMRHFHAIVAFCRKNFQSGMLSSHKFVFTKMLVSAVVYVSGRRRAPGEMNGKSANLNNCMRQIYPEGVPIPLNEMVCIFDADQVANPDFFLKTVPLFDAGDDVGMVLSPQVCSTTCLLVMMPVIHTASWMHIWPCQ